MVWDTHKVLSSSLIFFFLYLSYKYWKEASDVNKHSVMKYACVVLIALPNEIIMSIHWDKN
jgi:hypothetical protein